MKKIFPLVVIAVIFCSCNKSAPALSHWNIHGVGYAGNSFTKVNSTPDNTYITSADTGQANYVVIYFATLPTASGVYTLIPGTKDPVNNTECALTISDKFGMYSAKAKNGEVIVNISNGKIAAYFSNIIMTGSSITDTTLVSGALIQQ